MPGSYDAFLATFDESGGHRRSGLYGDASEQRGTSVAIDSGRHFILGSYFFGSINFGLFTHYGAGNADIAIAKFEADPTSAPSEAAHLNLSAWPNPFNPSTEIRFVLPESSRVDLGIYDVSGRLIRSFLKGDILAAGKHHVNWDGVNSLGECLPSGVYLCKLLVNEQSSLEKLVLLK